MVPKDFKGKNKEEMKSALYNVNMAPGRKVLVNMIFLLLAGNDSRLAIHYLLLAIACG